MELASNPIVEVAKALGGSFKLVTLAPKNCNGDDLLLRGVFLANNLASNDTYSPQLN